MPKLRQSDDLIADELPFFERPDLTPYLVHLTKNTIKNDEFSAFDNLVAILMNGEIWGSKRGKPGYIKGQNPATCFMDVPFLALKYILNEENTNPDNPRYEPYGIFVTKAYAYKKGCRPVLYLSEAELKAIGIGQDEVWRVVRFEPAEVKKVNWLHEREWRCKGNFPLPPFSTGVLVKNLADARKLQRMIDAEPKKFEKKPICIIPLTVLCQGLPRLYK